MMISSVVLSMLRLSCGYHLRGNVLAMEEVRERDANTERRILMALPSIIETLDEFRGSQGESR